MRHFCFLASALLLTSVASAQNASWTVSAGYSHLRLGSHPKDGLWYTKDGGYIDGDVNWLVRREPFPLLLGAGISAAGFYDTRDVPALGFFGDEALVSDLSLLSFEGRVSVPIQLSFARGFFLMPRLGAGLLIDDYAIDNLARTEIHTGAAFEIRPALQAGYSWGAGSVGAEFSYMAAWGDFGNLGAAGQEFRAGVFLRFRF